MLSSVVLLALTTGPVDDSIETIQAVGPSGQGQVAARAAATTLSGLTPDALIPIASAMGRNPLADNWLVGAFETIADDAPTADDLPIEEMKRFASDLENSPRGRRLVFELLRARGRDDGVPRLLHDPSPEMRYEAVNLTIEDAEKGERAGRATLYKAALRGATDPEQVERIVKALGEEGIEFDRLDHYRYLTDWKLIGPFDNKDEKAFDLAYPPEEDLAFGQTFSSDYGGETASLSWQEATVANESGELNLHEEMANHKGSVVYAVTAFESEDSQPIEFRVATANAFKLWLNGELLFSRPEYHRSKRFDQYRIPAAAATGKNTVLIKLLQNEQDQSWAQDYDVAVRVTNPNGLAADVRPVTP